MPDPTSDTIAALATAAGRGAIGIVRVSGPLAAPIARAITGAVPPARLAALCWFDDSDGERLDRGLTLFFPGPDSYTGEDVVELHGHGGPVLMEALLHSVLSHGARLAEPGEFTRRAFLNDKLDLAQAEAVADLIDCQSREAARAAARSLHGDFSVAIAALVDALTALRVYVEAAIDFPEEEIDFLALPEVTTRIDEVRARFDTLRRDARHGQLLRDGMTVVIAGVPNAGKSSLLNRLAGHDAAIVTDRAGTTRDVLREDIHIDGMPLRIVDTAGIRDSHDPIEQEGVRRAQAAMAGADRVLLVVDATAPAWPEASSLPPDVPVTVVRNKTDLLPAGEAAPSPAAPGEGPGIDVSALTGAGIDALREHLKRCMGFDSGERSTLIARRRHLDALQRAQQHVLTGESELREHAAGEIMAEELRLAQQCLGEITGHVSSDDLLGRIFSSFCIGK